MAKKREVSFEEFKRLRDNLKEGEILSVDLVEDASTVPSGEIEVPYGSDELHEIEGYGISYDDIDEYTLANASVSDGGFMLDDGEPVTYNGELIDLSSGHANVR